MNLHPATAIDLLERTLPVRPVFIIGCQRSGTTMLAAQLGRGANVVALPEMQFIADLLACETFDGREAIAAAYHRLISNFRFRVIELPFSLQEFETAATARGGKGVVLAIVRKYMAHHQLAKRGTEIVWVEHSPSHRSDVDFLLSHFHDARFIHIVRDPRGVYASMKSNPRFYAWEPLTFVRRWIFAVSSGHLSALERPDRCLEVRYEDLVRDPAGELSSICAFIGVPFSDVMLEGGGVILPKFTRKQHALTGQRADASKATDWTKRIHRREAETIEHFCGQWMKHYGYLSQVGGTPEPTRTEKFGWTLKFYALYFYTRMHIAVSNSLN